MTPEEWSAISDQVSNDMLAHVRPFVTPLSREEFSTVRLVGSGSYVAIGSRRILLTCEHVSRQAPLDYRFCGSPMNNVWGYRGQWTEEGHPADIAFAPISDAARKAETHGVASIPYERFAMKHAPCQQAELLFFMGYAGENSAYGFGQHDTNRTGYCSHEKMDTGDDQIFEIMWEPKNTRFASGTSEDAKAAMKFEDARGLSGSLAWNTRVLEMRGKGLHWTPADAVVTGLVRRWDDKTETLLVWRVEHVHAWLDAHR